MVDPVADAEAAGAASTGEQPDRGRKSSFWRELPVLIIVALVFTFLIQNFLGRVYIIPSESMEQTLYGCTGCVDDRVLVDKVTYDFSQPRPGDVVVFKGPSTWDESEFHTARSSNIVLRWLQEAAAAVGLAPPDEQDFVKRVIAVGGQTVSADPQKRILVDGKPLDEPYVYWEPGTGPADQRPFPTVQVPQGELFVMGDNRNNSLDSRYQGGGGVRGLVPVRNVIGKARLIVLPPSRWGVIDDHNPQAPAVVSAAGWQRGLPAGVGLAVAWPALRLGRRLRGALRRSPG